MSIRKGNTVIAGNNGDLNDVKVDNVSVVIDKVANINLTGAIVSNIVDNVTSTSTDKSLSAKQGKLLQDQITSLKSRGTYLSTWNCVIGLAGTVPQVIPRVYITGDYFIVSVIDNDSLYPDYNPEETYNTGSRCSHEDLYYICKEDNVTGEWDSTKWTSHTLTNYRPVGSSYDPSIPSETAETDSVSINDTYLYDGTTWILLKSEQTGVTFSSLAGQPSDNDNLAAALNSKAADDSVVHIETDETITGNKTFNGDLIATTQEAGDNSTKVATTAFVSTAISGKADDSGVVHIASDETITGNKTFTNNIYCSRDTTDIRFLSKTTIYTIGGTAPTSSIWGGSKFVDSSNNEIGCCSTGVDNNGNHISLLYVTNPNNTSQNANIDIKYQSDGTLVTHCPTPAVSSNSTEIATTSYINSKFQVVNSLPADPDPDTFYFIKE